jgi:hypothetical protein
MTYWATLYFAGKVVLTMGYTGQTLAQCQTITKLMIEDVENHYQVGTDNVLLSMFPTNEFTATCETEMLDVDPEYKE